MPVHRYEVIKVAHDDEGAISKSAMRRTHFADEEDSHKPCVNEDGYKVAFSRFKFATSLRYSETSFIWFK